MRTNEPPRGSDLHTRILIIGNASKLYLFRDSIGVVCSASTPNELPYYWVPKIPIDVQVVTRPCCARNRGIGINYYTVSSIALCWMGVHTISAMYAIIRSNEIRRVGRGTIIITWTGCIAMTREY